VTPLAMLSWDVMVFPYNIFFIITQNIMVIQ
jgi:hypothetical protein